MRRQGLSIIIPTYNEAGNIKGLITRIVNTMGESNIPYEIIFVDDHSTDGTKTKVSRTKGRTPTRVFVKKGKKGKGFSIMEGYSYSSFHHIAMLDADLQYPPEILPNLYREAQVYGFAVAKRKTYKSTLLRKFASRANALVFGKLLLGLDTDVQSGLKIFPYEVFEHLNPTLISGWAIDIPLIHTAYELGLDVGHVEMDFRPREEGESKIHFTRTAWEIASGAIKTRILRRPFILPPTDGESMRGSGFTYRRNKFVTHSTLSHHRSALVTFTLWQQLAIIGCIIVVAAGLVFATAYTVIGIVAALSAIYFIDVIFNLYVVLKSLHGPPEIVIPDEKAKKLDEDKLPIYSVLCPLYHEANVLPQFIQSMETIDWPKEKLDVLLLLEENDKATIAAAATMELPPYIRIIIVPDSQPKTKPKACNYGLSMAKGEYVVVYDAEDSPDVLQLRKAYLAFREGDPTVVCLQAKLNYYNPSHNLLTRLFTAEYSLWFDVILPGLQSISTSIPLGGTSNHFRRTTLMELEGWDPFNVTEDCDLGARLFKAGYKTAIIDSITLEEANSDVKNWFRQRSRWIKGYLQTYLVHLRNPISFFRQYGWHALIFQLIIGCRISFMVINPVLWLVTISYFTLHAFVGAAIESVYPAPVFYVAAFSLVFGNFTYLYNYMIGVAKRGHWGLVPYIFLVPIYWLMISISAGIALFQLFFKPHYWEKTIHGLHLDTAKKKEAPSPMRLKLAELRGVRIQRLADVGTGVLGGSILVASSLAGNVLNFLYNAYLSRRASLEDFGVISLIGSFLYISQVPLSALAKTVTHKSAYLLGKYNTPVNVFWASIRNKSYVAGLGIAGAWIGLTPLLMVLFKSNDPLPFLFFTPVWVVGTLSAVDNGFLRGNLQFGYIAMLAIIEAVSRLLFTIAFVELGLEQYVYAAVPLSMIVAFALGWWYAKKTPTHRISLPEKRAALLFPKRFFGTSILAMMWGISYLSLDLLMVKHYLSAVDAGAYSILTLAGKMVFFIGSLFSQFIVPFVSRDVGAGKQSRRIFSRIFLLMLLVNIGAFTIFGIFGHITVPLLWGEQSRAILQYLPLYTMAMSLYSLSSVFITYHQIQGNTVFPVAGFLMGAIQILGIALFHDSIYTICWIIAISSGISFVGILILDQFYGTLAALYRNLLDLAGLFQTLPETARLPGKRLRILVFNWRDLHHKWSGGAEVYIHELAKRWVTMGHQVTVFCGNDGVSQRHDMVDGVRIIRRGGFYFVYVWAMLYYLLRLKGKYDVIIDSENGIPFFTPLYAREKVFLLIHHVHQEVFRKSLLPPFSWIALFLEKRVMPMVYHKTEVITVSPSSKMEILANKLTKKEPHIIYNGVDLRICKPGEKSERPTVLYLGRLTSLKSLSVLIYAAQKIIEQVPKAQFVIAGDGPDKNRLIKMVKKLHLDHIISFTGRVTEEEKIKLYQKAWVFVNPSLIEGWGITTIEANACGTPVVASNVAGLRDAVHNPHSGLLLPYGNINEFASAIARLLTNTQELNSMSKDSLEWAKKFDWEKSAKDSIALLE